MDNNLSKLAAPSLSGESRQPLGRRSCAGFFLQHNALVMLLVLVAVASSLSADVFHLAEPG
ncbi:monosaccharide-transporting ATPase [Pseudomonas putida S11]|nr:monosaccharide-transporting ATPase [Pseudomonas putida S11]